MRVPEYIKKMIKDRCRAQMRANKLQVDIENWFEAHNIDVEYSGTHIVLYTEPDTARSKYLEVLEEHKEG